MLYLNIREGFACNSSSSHSFLLIDEKSRDVVSENDYSSGNFGWDAFTLTANQSKTNYLLNLVKHAYEKKYVNKDIHIDIDSIFEKYIFNGEEQDYGIDHQSVIEFTDTHEGVFDCVFFNKFLKYTNRENVAILGGNDNSGEHYHKDKGIAIKIPLAYESNNNYITRYDHLNNCWTLFDKNNGDKKRFILEHVFDAKNFTEKFKKGYAPELVDVKITDYCDFGCKYCYQGSTVAGKHADWNYLQSLVTALKNAEVMECACGGGDPTYHPHFFDFIELLSSNGIVPNVTTRRPFELLSDERHKLIKGLAVSIDNLQDLNKVYDFVLQKKAKEEELPEINLQIVEGTMDKNTLKSIKENVDKFLKNMQEENYYVNGFTYTFLGFKNDNRGKNFEHNGVNLFQVIKDLGFYSFKVDTAFVRKYESYISAADIKSERYSKDEGGWSCYVDAVSQEIASCSYGSKAFETKQCFADPSDFIEKFAMLPVISEDS